MNNHAFLPPSTRNRGVGSINVDRMEAGYNFIAQSISNLARQQTVCRPDLITDDLIKTFKDKSDLQQIGADDSLLALYDQKINDLQNERRRSERFYNNKFPSAEDATN